VPGQGRPFEPGPDPRRNAGGRPRGLSRLIRDRFGENGEKLLDWLEPIAAGTARQPFITRTGEVVQVGPAFRDQVAAILALIAHGHGTMPKVVQVEPGEGVAGLHITFDVGGVALEGMSDDDLEWIAKRRREEFERLRQQRAEPITGEFRALPAGAPPGDSGGPGGDPGGESPPG
jgi:hypothetical protein